MNEKQLLGYLLLVLRNAGYKRAIDALIEDAAERGFTVTELEDDGTQDGYFSVDYTLDDDGVIRGHRLTDEESRDAMLPELPIWTDIGLLDPIETEPAPMDPELEAQILKATEAIYDRLGIVRSGPDILSHDELKRIVEESEKDGRETYT